MSDRSNSPGVNEQDQVYAHRALFAGLVYNEQGEPVPVAYIGGVAHYAIPDTGFMRHVEAAQVDQAVVASLKGQMEGMQDELVRAMLQMLGKDDLFTKAALEASIRNMDHSILQSDPAQWAPMLGMMGFRVVVDLHGNVVQVVYPSRPDGEGDEGWDGGEE